ncbi:MAG: OmpH family outer membrane protein [Rhodothermales bacterium]
MTFTVRVTRFAALLVFALPTLAFAQQKIAYVDSDYILGLMPDYATIQQNLDRMAQEWETELDTQRAEVDEMFQQYQARELLYVAEERKRKRDEIIQAEDDLERQRMRYFGPEGELFNQQEQLMRPLQERILTAIEEVATEEGYDYVFDKNGGEVLFLFAQQEHNVSDRVLEKLGIDLENTQRGSR